MINIGISGINGSMGQILYKKIVEDDMFNLVMGIDARPELYENKCRVFEKPADSDIYPDLIIDFSHHSCLDELLLFAKEHGISLVLATTGYDAAQIEKIHSYSSDIAILYSANMSFGINLLKTILEKYSRLLDERSYDIEIIEKHHNKKVDAPSGTAYILADAVNSGISTPKNFVNGRQGRTNPRTTNEIGIHAVRGGNIFGEHEVIFAGSSDIIEIKHTALSKDLFADGAIDAAKWLYMKEKGMYCMQDMFEI